MSKRTDLVSIVIVTCGKKDYLKFCLDSIREQTYSALEIIVIDNSGDESLSKEIYKCYPDIKLYPQRKNLFYSQALNLGIEKSKGDFILCLNDDVILDRRFIEEALKGFSIDKRIGMVSGKILRFDRKTIDSTGLFLTCWRTAKERGYGLKDRGQYNLPGYIFGVNGAVAFFSRGMLESVKISSDYFDSEYRIFYEDLDIAWRANNLGWRGYYIPTALAYHLRGGTVREKKGINKRFAQLYLINELEIDLIKNRYLTIIKNENFLDFLLHLPFIILYDLLIYNYILIFRPQLIIRLLRKIVFINSAFRKRRLLKKS